jgi:hypothetical protein
MALQVDMQLRIWDVEHDAYAMLRHQVGNSAGRLTMADPSCTSDWWLSLIIKYTLGRGLRHYPFVNIADPEKCAPVYDATARIVRHRLQLQNLVARSAARIRGRT